MNEYSISVSEIRPRDANQIDVVFAVNEDERVLFSLNFTTTSAELDYNRAVLDAINQLIEALQEMLIAAEEWGKDE